MDPQTSNLRSPHSFHEPRRILVRGVNWLGDAVMTTPALTRLRERFPRAHITLLTHEKLADLWLHHPSLDEILTFAPNASPWAVARRLRRETFDVGLVLPYSHRSALEIWLARIPRRIGYTRGWRFLLMTHAVAPSRGHAVTRKRSIAEIKRLIRVSPTPNVSSQDSGAARPGEGKAPAVGSGAHQIHEYLHLAAALGANAEPVEPFLEVRDDELHAVREKWLSGPRTSTARLPDGQNPIWLGINPSAAYGPAKRWPVQNFAVVVREVSQRIGKCGWLVFGDAKDVRLCREIERAAAPSVINLAGQTSLRELMALLKLCRAVLTNDTGPMHVAAALGTRVVVPFGSTAPDLTGPGLPGDHRHYMLQSGAPCSPCFRRVCPIDLRCLTGITPAQVVDAVCQAVSRP